VRKAILEAKSGRIEHVAANDDATAPNPAATYIESLGEGSRRTMAQAIEVIRDVLFPGVEIDGVQWHLVTYVDAVSLRAHLAARYSPASGNKILAAFRGVLRAAFLQGDMTSDQMTRACAVKAIRGASAPVGRALEAGELTALHAASEARRPVGAARDRALLALLHGAGLRRAELVALDLGDLDVERADLRVRGKGAKVRVVPLPAWAVAAVAAWVAIRGDGEGPLLFPVGRADRIVRRRLQAGSIADVLERLGGAAHVEHFGPHDMRRTYASALLTEGTDVATVQALVGHASPATTVRSYDRRGDACRRRAVERLEGPGRAA
jgi:site-specific recombinase XerC